jgi:hypothetical protein
MPAFASLPITCDRINNISGPGVKINGSTVKAKSTNTDISFPFLKFDYEKKTVSFKMLKIGFQIFYNDDYFSN